MFNWRNEEDLDVTWILIITSDLEIPVITGKDNLQNFTSVLRTLSFVTNQYYSWILSIFLNCVLKYSKTLKPHPNMNSKEGGTPLYCVTDYIYFSCCAESTWNINFHFLAINSCITFTTIHPFAKHSFPLLFDIN